MAVSIDTTVGGASANSYASLADATTYMEGRLNASTWDDADTDTQNRALVEATRELEILPWAGRRTDDVQVLAWPRYWVIDVDDPNQNYYDDDEIPRRVKDAQMELAFQFIKAGTTDLSATIKDEGVIRKKVDVLETEYASPSLRRTGLLRYPRVWGRLKPLLTSTGASVRLVRG